IVDIITRINQARRESPALHGYNNVLFLATDNRNIIAYAKMTDDRSDIVVCAVNLDPFHQQVATVQIPLGTFDIAWDEQYQAHDLL
ncbi:MAG TPA: alpha-1,4-glucan--maltose-1-phosphate maltosyltransferase, partial [Candidatus Accumulibacter sp.]|nr:alpha-1,4-glucan--maltose-1-phosphate maltosyltransferase [Accumulibacter sp.]